MLTYNIVREGLMFRAVCDETGFKSPLLTSASQAGLLIQRRAGPDAYRAAVDRFAIAEAKSFRDWHFARKVSNVSH